MNVQLTSSLHFVDPQTMNFVETAPPYHAIGRGLNLRGGCDNSSCEAYRQVVWIQKGYGTFEIGNEIQSSVCPSCHKLANRIQNLGLWGCQYSLDGYHYFPDEKKIEEMDQIASQESFTTPFNQDGKQAQWIYLTITTKPITL